MSSQPQPEKRKTPIPLYPRQIIPPRPPQTHHERPNPRPKREAKIETLNENSMANMPSVVVYHAGTGKVVLIGLLRVAVVLTFVGFSLIVVPAFYANPESPSFLPPLLFVGGCLPLIFVSYTSAPFVNSISMKVPANVIANIPAMRQYFNHLPKSTTVQIETMKFLFWPRYTIASVKDLIPASSVSRPITFKTLRPDHRPWYAGGNKSEFYAAAPRSTPEAPTKKYRPEGWVKLFESIQSNRPKKPHQI